MQDFRGLSLDFGPLKKILPIQAKHKGNTGQKAKRQATLQNGRQINGSKPIQWGGGTL
jgi:hypothetical protein